MKKILVMILLYMTAIVELVGPPFVFIRGALDYFKECLAEGVGMLQLWTILVYGVALALVVVLAVLCFIALIHIANSVSDVMD